MTSPLRDEPQQWVREDITNLVNTLETWGRPAFESDTNFLVGGLLLRAKAAIEDLSTKNASLENRAAPKDSKHIERAMELAQDYANCLGHFRRVNTTEALTEVDGARAALRRHLEGGES